jgi:phosphoribosylamine-glycine ligase
MKILMHSNNGDGIALAERFKKEGHKVWVYIDVKDCRRMGDNLVDKVDSMMRGMAENPDCVIFDMSGAGELADRLRKAGVKVLGGSAFADKMETDRKFGIDLARQYGMKVPESSDFKDIEEAVKHIKTKPKAYAIKMSGGESGCASSYVAKDAEDMLEYIAWQKDRKLIKPGMEFVLQEVIKGVEISTEVWFSDGRPLLPYNSTFENKKFLPGDLGPNTGCETSAVFPYLSSNPKIIEKTLRKTFKHMKELRWTGPLDVNCIVSERNYEPYFLEWTPRIGYSAIYALAAMLEGDLARFFYNVAHGTFQEVPIKNIWGTSLKLSVSPYPLERPELPDIEHRLYSDIEGMRINAPEGPNLWLIDAKKSKEGKRVVAGVNGIVAECTGAGRSLHSAWLTSRSVFDSVEIPGKMGRYVDGGMRAYKDSKKIKSWGYEAPDPDGSNDAKIDRKRYDLLRI